MRNPRDVTRSAISFERSPSERFQSERSLRTAAFHGVVHSVLHNVTVQIQRGGAAGPLKLSGRPNLSVARRASLAIAIGAVASVALAGTPDRSRPIESHHGAVVADAPVRPAPRPLAFDGLVVPGERWLHLPGVTGTEIDAADAAARACPTCPPAPGNDASQPAASTEERGQRRIGFVRPVAQFLGRTARPETDFAIRRLPDGRIAATLAVTSPGAQRMRLHFTDVDLGDGSLLVWAPYEAAEGEGAIVRGRYDNDDLALAADGSRELWTASVPGDTLFVEFVGSELPTLALTGIVHRDRDPRPVGGRPNGGGAEPPPRDAPVDDLPRERGPRGWSTDLQSGEGGVAGGPLPCHVDVNCQLSSHPNMTNPKNATGQMNFVENGTEFVCTGTLLNDLDNETTVPWFLTAYHCFSTQASASSLEVVWGWETNSCDGSLPDYDLLPRSVGSTLTKLNESNDMCFLRLHGTLPAGTALAGWTTALPDTAYGVHQPGGSWKRWTEFEAVSICGACTFCGDPTEFQFYNAIEGLTEPGSSGSGIFSPQGQLFGQLYGRCTDVIGNPPVTCSTIDDFWFYYGEFEETYPIISAQLIVGGTFWANAAYPPGQVEIGSLANPFNTFGEAYSATFDGAQIKLIGGSYPVTGVYSKEITISAPFGTATIGQ